MFWFMAIGVDAWLLWGLLWWAPRAAARRREEVYLYMTWKQYFKENVAQSWIFFDGEG